MIEGRREIAKDGKISETDKEEEEDTRKMGRERERRGKWWDRGENGRKRRTRGNGIGGARGRVRVIERHTFRRGNNE